MASNSRVIVTATSGCRETFERPLFRNCDSLFKAFGYSVPQQQSHLNHGKLMYYTPHKWLEHHKLPAKSNLETSIFGYTESPVCLLVAGVKHITVLQWNKCGKTRILVPLPLLRKFLLGEKDMPGEGLVSIPSCGFNVLCPTRSHCHRRESRHSIVVVHWEW